MDNERTVKYNITSGIPLTMDHNYAHCNTIVLFDGFEAQGEDTTFYFLLGAPLQYMIPLTDDMTVLITREYTKKAGKIKGQLLECKLAENSTDTYEFMRYSNVFDVIITPSLAAASMVEVTDPRLELVYTQMHEAYLSMLDYEHSAQTYAESASASATTAITKAGEALASATSAASSASTASGAATTATTKASEASASATSAFSSASTATTKASEAAASATAAAASVSEVTDIRVGADGTTYPTAGDAVRAIGYGTNTIFEILFNTEMLDPTVVYSATNSAVTNNNDGTYTLGTTDYGTIIFGKMLYLKKGTYKIFGVPQGFSFLSTTTNYTDAFATNNGTTAKFVEIATDTTCYLGYRNTVRPSSAFTIAPYLLGNAVDESSGVTEEIKQALLSCFKVAAWVTPNGRSYYDVLENALYPLPTGYKRVKYLKSDATDATHGSYLNTGVVFNNPTVAEYRIGFMGEEGNTSIKYPIGVREKGTGNTNSVGWGLVGFENNVQFASWSGGTGANITFPEAYTRHDMVATWKDGELTLQDGYGTPVVSTQTTRKIDQYPICLFGLKPATSLSSGSIFCFRGRIYYAEALQDGVPIMRVFPCVRTSDNAVGMYDVINKAFYTPYNVNGGTITAGEEL